MGGICHNVDYNLFITLGTAFAAVGTQLNNSTYESCRVSVIPDLQISPGLNCTCSSTGHVVALHGQQEGSHGSGRKVKNFTDKTKHISTRNSITEALEILDDG